MKTAAWLVDPTGSLPTLPPPLPMALDDDGDAVAAHDAQEADYYRARSSSPTSPWRMAVKEARDSKFQISNSVARPSAPQKTAAPASS